MRKILQTETLQPGTSTKPHLVNGFADSDLEGAVRDVAIQAVTRGDAVVDDALFEKCFSNIVPLTKTAPEKIEAIRLWGRERAAPASGVSWHALPTGKVPGKRSIFL